jgi:hypothetical protein
MSILGDVDFNIGQNDIFVLKRKLFNAIYKDVKDRISSSPFNCRPLDIHSYPNQYNHTIFTMCLNLAKNITMYDLYSYFGFSKNEIIQFCNSDINDIIESGSIIDSAVAEMNRGYDNMITIGHTDFKTDDDVLGDLIYACFKTTKELALNYFKTGDMPISIYYVNGQFNTNVKDIVNGTCPYFKGIKNVVKHNNMLELYSVEKIVKLIEKNVLCHHIAFNENFTAELKEFLKEPQNNI